MKLLDLKEIKKDLKENNTSESKNFLDNYFDPLFRENEIYLKWTNKFIPTIIKDGNQYIWKIIVINKETLELVYSSNLYSSENLFFLLIFLLQDKELTELLNNNNYFIWGILNSANFLYSQEQIRNNIIKLEERIKLNFNI